MRPDAVTSTVCSQATNRILSRPVASTLLRCKSVARQQRKQPFTVSPLYFTFGFVDSHIELIGAQHTHT